MDTPIYQLPYELTIYEVDEVYQELLHLMNTSQAIYLDASLVKEMDAAGFQLIVWFVKWAAKNNVLDPFSDISEYLDEYVSLFDYRLIVSEGDI